MRFPFRATAPALAFLIAGLQFLAPHVRAAVFDPDTFTLDNGMQVVVIENHRVPVVTHMVWYKAGSADEAPGESGAAHLLEHMMFKGTPAYPDGEFSRIVARHGGRENAFTSYDYTGYYQTVAKEHLELVMALEADRMTNLVLEDDDFETERQVVMEERRQRTDNNPSAVLSEQVDAALYLNHPYQHPVIGWEHELEALTRDSLRSFYERWYAPDNAVLVVAGDITADALRPLAEKHYGSIEAADAPPRVRPSEPPHRAARTVTYMDDRVRQPSWRRTYIAPSYVTGEAEHAYALQVLADILGGGPTSRLYRALVVEEKLAVSAGAWYGADRLGPSEFTVYASPQPEVAMDTVAAAVEDEIARIVEDGVTAEEVDKSITSMKARVVYARDDLSSGARVLGEALATGRTAADVEAWPERMAAVTPEAVQAAARHVFKAEKSVTAKLLRAGGDR